MVRHIPLSFLFLLFLIHSASAQTPLSENILRLDDPANSPSASIEQMAWLQGYWQGEGMGGTAEEVWSPPSAGAMMGVFRFITDDTTSFYEMVTLTEESGSLMLRLKHFHPDLKGWEEKDETVDFPLVKIEGATAWFDGLTIQRLSEEEMNIYVMIGTQGESSQEVVFSYRRSEL